MRPPPCRRERAWLLLSLSALGDADCRHEATSHVTSQLPHTDSLMRVATLCTAPDLCSRVGFVNFALTQSGLEAQCLEKLLRSQRPELQAQRVEVLKLQGEYRARLHALEQSLLSALSGLEGNILDNDVIMRTLESVKAESLEISVKAEQAEGVMVAVAASAAAYQPLADQVAAVFFALLALSHVGHIYRYSLPFFLDIFDCVLQSSSAWSLAPAEAAVAGELSTPVNEEALAAQLSSLEQGFYDALVYRVLPGLLQDDRLTLGLCLVRIRNQARPDARGATLWAALLNEDKAACGAALRQKSAAEGQEDTSSDDLLLAMLRARHEARHCPAASNVLTQTPLPPPSDEPPAPLPPRLPSRLPSPPPAPPSKACM